MEQERRSRSEASVRVVRQGGRRERGWMVARVREIGRNGCVLRTADPFRIGALVVKVSRSDAFSRLMRRSFVRNQRLAGGPAFRLKPHFVGAAQKMAPDADICDAQTPRFCSRPKRDGTSECNGRYSGSVSSF